MGGRGGRGIKQIGVNQGELGGGKEGLTDLLEGCAETLQAFHGLALEQGVCGLDCSCLFPEQQDCWPQGAGSFEDGLGVLGRPVGGP